MIKKFLVSIALVTALGMGTAYAADAQAPAAGAANPAEMMNPFAWMGVYNNQVPNVQRLNLARPEGYAVFMNPMNYGQFMNPATYGQFMTPQFYMQFADPNNMMASSLENYREEVSGVSLDEEMVDLIQFQSAYQAAAKIINTVDEMLDSLMNIV